MDILLALLILAVLIAVFGGIFVSKLLFLLLIVAIILAVFSLAGRRRVP
jgi:hypothetical protein